MDIPNNLMHYCMGGCMKKTVLLTLGSGGHTKQSIILSKDIGNKVNYEYVINNDDNISEQKILYKGKIFKIIRPRKLNENKIFTIFRTAISFFDALSIILRSKSKMVISTGPGLAFPLMFWAKVFGKKTVFIESWSRVTKPSLAGKLCYRISDQFFIQWPDLKRQYPKATYAGRLA